jgi:site-specific recombinase XerD
MVMLLSEAIEALCIATRADGRTVRTVDSYREKLSHLVAFLGDVSIEEITLHDLRIYVADMRDRSTIYIDHHSHRPRRGGLSEFTIAGRVRAFKRLFRWLVLEGILEVNPAERIKTPRPKRREPKSVDWDDVVAVLATTEGDTITDVRDRAIIFLLTDSACRVGGLCDLRVQDVDLHNRCALVTEKGGKTRPVFFTGDTAQALAVWLEVRPQDKGAWLFVGFNQRSKGKLTSGAILQMLKRRARRVGVTGTINPHAFRHAFARHYLLSGGDLGTLADLLGHSDVSVTKAFYGIFTREELREKHARHSPISQLVGGNEDDER